MSDYDPNKPKEEPQVITQVAQEQRTFRPLYEQVDMWSYEVETLPDSNKFMADGVTPRVMLRGILQRAETINQNKRVYPYSILKREVDNYQRFIKENRAFGECVDSETSIFTVKDGWKSISEVKEGELIYTLDIKTNTINIEPVLYKTERKHVGDILHIYNGNGNIDMILTENHKMLVYDRYGKPFYIKASELEHRVLNSDSEVSKWSIRGIGKWNSTSPPSFSVRQKKESIKSKIRSLLSRIKIPFRENIYEPGARGSYLNLRSLNIERKHFNDNVYCVTTGNGNWLAQRKGKMFWTGNCDHPDSSVVELKNVSHIIRETWWDGNDLYGRVEVLNTEAGKVVRELINAGTTIGISSRGVGSTRNEGGVDIVQEDFMLICWDVVSEPSTPGAFMFKEHKEPNISRSLVENARTHWGLNYMNVFQEGLVKDEFSKTFCKTADYIISLYETIKERE